MAKKAGLGKGLSALISDDSSVSEDHSYVPNLPIDQIAKNPYQPRMEIEEESLMGLADSIREHGIIEPLIVTQKGKRKFELIVGERRLKAAKLAGLEVVPVVVKESSPRQMIELAIVENIQRSDLNPLEEALAFKQLSEEHNLSHKDVAQKVGLSRPTIVNKIRLLQLPDEVKKGLLQELLTEGHARALLGLKSKQAIIAAYKKVVKQNMSVRATEEMVRRINAKTKQATQKTKQKIDKATLKFEDTLRKSLGVKVRIKKSKRGGKIVIPFKSDEDFNKVYKLLT